MAALLVIIASGASGDVQGACQCEGNNFSSDCLHDLFQKAVHDDYATCISRRERIGYVQSVTLP